MIAKQNGTFSTIWGRVALLGIVPGFFIALGLLLAFIGALIGGIKGFYSGLFVGAFFLLISPLIQMEMGNIVHWVLTGEKTDKNYYSAMDAIQEYVKNK